MCSGKKRLQINNEANYKNSLLAYKNQIDSDFFETLFTGLFISFKEGNIELF